MKKIFGILKPGGIAYFIVHNEQALQAKIFGEKSPIYDVEHIYLFNQKTLAKLCEKTGFNVVKTWSVKNTYPLHYWLRMAPLPFKKQITGLVSVFGLLNLNIGIKPGNLGIFVRKA